MHQPGYIGKKRQASPSRSTMTEDGYRTKSGRLSKIAPWISEQFVGMVALPNKPSTFEESVHTPAWRSAMEEEIDSINKNATWELTELPPSKNPISTK